MSSVAHILNQHGDALSRRTSTSSDHSEIPSYPQSASHSSVNVATFPNAVAARELDPRASLQDNRYDSTPLRGGHRRPQHRPDTASTAASYTSASADSPSPKRLSLASATSSRHPRTQKPVAPSRIGRDFEALLASDETYVLRDSAKVALDPEDSVNGADQGLLPSASTGSNRVIVQRRRQQSASSSSSLANDLDEADEDDGGNLLDTTPRPPHAGVFSSPQSKVPTSSSSGTLLKSVSGQVRRHGPQIPTSPDRTTSLQRHTANSPSAASSTSKRQASAMPTTPNFKAEADGGDGTLRARPRFQSSIGLEHEIQASSSSQNGANGAGSTGTFRQRMKKTSGFLRKLRKDSTPFRREQEAPSSNAASAIGHAYSIGSNAAASSLGRSGASDSTLGIAPSGRRGSRTSVVSQGASSTTGSTSKSPYFASTDGVAVPSIPERFMQTSTSSYSNLAPASAATEAPAYPAAVPSEMQHLAVASKTGVRVPSAPATLTDWSPGTTKLALPQRSSSQGHEHERNKSLASSDSAGAIRLAVQQLSSHMDTVWKDSPSREVKIAELRNAPAQKQSWGPSPQLPGLDIQRYKERSGSFLEEPDIVSSNGFDDDTLSEPPQTARSHSAFPCPDSTAHADVSAAPTKKAAGLGIQNGTFAAETIRRTDFKDPGHRADSPQYLDSARSSQRNSNSIDPAASAVPRRTTHSSASVVSARSFETAAESTGLNSAGPQSNSFPVPSSEKQRAGDASALSPRFSPDQVKSPLSADALPAKSPDAVAGVRLVKDGTHELQPSDGEDDREQSIRLVTKRSNTVDLSPGSDWHDSSTTAIVTAPASPDMASSGLPKVIELSESSFLRPGGNSSISRRPSTASASVRGGRAALLSTPSVRRSPSPAPQSTSTRTSFEAPALQPADADVVRRPSIAASAQELAAKCWQEDPTFLKREKIAEWLGGLGLVNRAARGYYFANFDFGGLRLDVAFRKLCDKLFLRAETQQIDRILAAFSQRYYECNPESVFGSADVVHSVVFSILLLNTDLHIAELQERMTRQQFVRNTLGAIAESSPDGAPFAAHDDDSRSSFGDVQTDLARSTDAIPTTAANRRSSVIGYLGVRSKQTSSTVNLDSSSDAVHSSRPAIATSGAKEAEIETLLRDIYAAVKSERILLPSPETGGAGGRPSGAFSPTLGGRRKMGTGNDRMTALKRGSIRGIQGLLGGLGPNNLLDPAISPNPSRSSFDSWGRPSQSLASSADRMSMLSPPITPGFASTLSQTIIKESKEEDTAIPASSTTRELDEEDDDDQLALAGPPWAKEGSLTRKHYWESTGKRAKDKTWTEVFAVVSKGMLSMFRFNASSSAAKGGVLGGGNWLSNATCLGEIPLAHSLANALPPPGYNKSRPHVFALTLPGGRVYFFQTGHEELVNEWVSTCNYWAARQSKEPLAGGVSNMEYGWNKVLPQEDVEELDGSISHRDDRSVMSGASKQRSLFTTSINTASNAGYMSHERTFINEWRLPQLPTVPSTLSEERQLARLEKQVALIEADLTTHNDLRTPMLHLYSPKGVNYAKALANWERKSNWLLQELVKYHSYVEALKRSLEGKAERRAKREVEEMVREGDAMLAELKV